MCTFVQKSSRKVMIKRIFATLLLAFSFLSSWTQNLSEESMDSLRRTDGFVTASLCVADPTDWQDDMLGVLGHAFIRLQCPTFDLDYVFSYESESADEEMGEFLSGKLHMGMFSVPTDEYLATFKKWNCAIHEYTLNLPPEAKLRLWEIMDLKVAEGQDLQLDLIKHGCAQTLVQFVEQATYDTPIQYGTWPKEFSMNSREIINKHLEPYPWIRFLLSDLFLTSDATKDVPNERKLLVPAQMVEVWQQATINGKPLITYKADLIEAPAKQPAKTWLTPLLLSLLFLVLTVAFACTRYRAFDWFMLGIQFLMGLLLVWLVLVSNLPGTKGAHLLLLYNPLPLLLWKWHERWAKPYAVLLVLWVLTMCVMPNFYVETAHFVFALSIVVILLKDIVKARLTRKA